MNLDELKLILVPTDFSESSANALRVAVQLAQKLRASIAVFHVDIDPTVVLPPPGDVLAVPLVFERIQAQAEERLQSAADEVRRAGVTCTTASELGRTHTTIVEQARRVGAGLIVMGSHARHGLGHALLGSVAERVIRHAPCPVLVVPTPSGP
jgi:nucleotide-binding universal stress UspA family protein